ncbi:hypothetical protein BJ912DRAFT_970842 [Pholiota molesta]|nr:hypothetical protein BJ912DRAFT_970842 [Pholiota molesta]
MGKGKLPLEPFGKLIRSDFWFHDGNIVIIAGSAAFKVHRGQLERRSEVFSDLFSIPQPKEQELIDGCPYVELQDCPSDVFYFLSALYDGLYFKKARASDFPIIAAHLRQRCIAHLDADWPSTLTGWDMREQRSTDDNGRYVPRDHCAHPILTAYERLLHQLHNTPLLERPVRLSRDLLCPLHGRFIARELHCRAPAEECLHRLDKDSPSRPCHESFYFIMLNILRSVGGIACGRDADPLYTLTQASEMLTRTDFSDGQRQSAAKAREEVWSLLPQWFGFVEGDNPASLLDLD